MWKQKLVLCRIGCVGQFMRILIWGGNSKPGTDIHIYFKHLQNMCTCLNACNYCKVSKAIIVAIVMLQTFPTR